MRRPKRACKHPVCKTLTRNAYCDEHKAEYVRELRERSDRRRPSSSQRGYTTRWNKARVNYLRSNPLCRRCEGEGRLTPAQCVDHIKPHRGDQMLFWDMSNWQPLCYSCHNTKTANEDGGFGRKPNCKGSQKLSEGVQDDLSEGAAWVLV